MGKERDVHWSDRRDRRHTGTFQHQGSIRGNEDAEGGAMARQNVVTSPRLCKLHSSSGGECAPGKPGHRDLRPAELRRRASPRGSRTTISRSPPEYRRRGPTPARRELMNEAAGGGGPKARLPAYQDRQKGLLEVDRVETDEPRHDRSAQAKAATSSRSSDMIAGGPRRTAVPGVRISTTNEEASQTRRGRKHPAQVGHQGT